MGPGGEGSSVAAALQQAADPGGRNVKAWCEVRTARVDLLASADDAFAEVLPVGLHQVLLSYSHDTHLATCKRETL